MGTFTHHVRAAKNSTDFAEQSLAAEVFFFHFTVENQLSVVAYVAPRETASVKALNRIADTSGAQSNLPFSFGYTG